MLFARVDETARDELNQALKTADQTKWYVRVKSIDMSAQGQTISEIAEFFDLNYNTIRGYINRYNKGGLDGLKPKYGKGRRAAITLNKNELREILERSPSQFEKLETGARNWNQALMSRYLWHYHQIEVSQGAISGTFKRLGIAWNRAKKRSPHPTHSTPSNDNGSNN